RQQDEHLITEVVALGGRHEQAAATHEWHIGVEQRALVLDRQRQDALTWCPAYRRRRHREVLLRSHGRRPPGELALRCAGGLRFRRAPGPTGRFPLCALCALARRPCP